MTEETAVILKAVERLELDHPAISTCPVCGKKTLNTLPSRGYLTYGGRPMIAMFDTHVPLVIIVCRTCGNMRFFSAVMLGAVKREPGNVEELPKAEDGENET